MQCEVRGFVLSPSRGPASDRQASRAVHERSACPCCTTATSPASLSSSTAAFGLSEYHLGRASRQTPDDQLEPTRSTACGGPLSSSGHQYQHQRPLKGTAPVGSDAAAPQACGTNKPLKPGHCRRAAVVISIVSMQPTKLLRARCAAGDGSHVLTQAKRLPASQRTAPCKQYVERGRSRRADDTNAKLARGALSATLANSQMRPIESCESAHG